MGYNKILTGKGYRNINPDTSPKSFKELKGFLSFSNGNDCFSKFSGKVYKITEDCTWIEVCRNITDLSFNEYLKLSKT